MPDGRLQRTRESLPAGYQYRPPARERSSLADIIAAYAATMEWPHRIGISVPDEPTVDTPWAV